MLKEIYTDAYAEGFHTGYLIGMTKSLITAIRKLSETECSEYFESYPSEYYEEIVAIMNKYPNYKLKRLAEKVLFESTYLPY